MKVGAALPLILNTMNTVGVSDALTATMHPGITKPRKKQTLALS
jgi:hypothetical protein